MDDGVAGWSLRYSGGVADAEKDGDDEAECHDAIANVFVRTPVEWTEVQDKRMYRKTYIKTDRTILVGTTLGAFLTSAATVKKVSYCLKDDVVSMFCH